MNLDSQTVAYKVNKEMCWIQLCTCVTQNIYNFRERGLLAAIRELRGAAVGATKPS